MNEAVDWSVLCTLGHLGHGKSTLVEALTQIPLDPQLTQDLRSAWLTLPSGRTLGIIDAPGHADFLDLTTGGLASSAAFLLVVAADEGVMPQTLDHLQLAQLLGVKRGVVVITKIDLAESPDGLDETEFEILEHLTTFNLDIPILRVSTLTGSGLEDLKLALDRLCETSPNLPDQQQPHLPIDSVYTVAGLGTVVTGTLLGGHLEIGQMLVIQPSDLPVRIRGLYTANQATERASVGSRVAVNLSGVDKTDVRRGDVLALVGTLHPTLLADISLELLSPHQLKSAQEVQVMAGGATRLAQVQLLSHDELHVGEIGAGQFTFTQPLILRNRMRFVVRSGTGELLGGGMVLDSWSEQTWARHDSSVLERFEVLTHGDPMMRLVYELRRKRVPQRLQNFEDQSALAEARRQGGLFEFEGYIAHPEAIASLREQAIQILTAFHADNPLLVGMDGAEFLRQLGLTAEDDIVVRVLAAQGVIEAGRVVKLPQQGMVFTKAQRKIIDSMLARFEENPYNPPTYKEVLDGLKDDKVLKALLAQGEFIFIPPDVVLRPTAYEALLAAAHRQLAGGGVLTVATLRDEFDSTRRVILPFLDWLEKQGVTIRTEEGHRLKT